MLIRGYCTYQKPQDPPEAMASTRNHRVDQRPQCPPKPSGSTRDHGTHQSPHRLLFNIDKGEQEARLSCPGLREIVPTGCSLGFILLLHGPASPDSKTGVGRTQGQSQPWATDKLTDK